MTFTVLTASPSPPKLDASGMPVLTRTKVERLRRVIETAWRCIPFYATHWRCLADRFDQLQFPRDLGELPVVHKADLLRFAIADRIDPLFRHRRLVSERSSGSSAQPFEVLKDRGAVRRRSLRFLRALAACGYRPGQRLFLISTRRRSTRTALLRWTYADLRDSDQSLLQQYNDARPHVLYGPLSSLLQIIEGARACGVRLHRPRCVISTAELLSEEHRNLLGAAFRSPVGDFYGMTEFGLMAWRRPGVTTYDVVRDGLLLEYRASAEGRAVERLIVTDLDRVAMPLIRYETGDLVRRDHGHADKPIRGFLGRTVDSIALPGGKRVSPYHITTSIETIPGLRQYQVVQREDFSIDIHFESEGADSVGQQLLSRLFALCGDQIVVRPHWHHEPLDVGHGKLRPVRSEVR